MLLPKRNKFCTRSQLLYQKKLFNINGERWYVLLVPPHFKKLNGAWGSCDDNDKTIYIDETLSKEKTYSVLCHEITHAAMFSYNVNLTIEQEEFVADLIATYGNEIIAITNEIFNKIKGNY